MAMVKKKSYENLTAGNIQRVIEALGQDSPITKKEACEMLNIAYKREDVAMFYIGLTSWFAITTCLNLREERFLRRSKSQLR